MRIVNINLEDLLITSMLMSASTVTKIFATPTDLINFADKFIRVERLLSLRKDVDGCLNTTSIFPAILYCFSTIEANHLWDSKF